MNIGVVGLGLIGGSLAKAYKKKGFTVLAWNRNKVITDFAKMSGDIDGELTAENLEETLAGWREFVVNYDYEKFWDEDFWIAWNEAHGIDMSDA